MKNTIQVVLIFFIAIFMTSFDFPTHYNSFDNYPIYNDNDLEVTYTPSKTTFKIWSPDIDSAKVRLYKTGIEDDPIETMLMIKKEDGIWEVSADGDLKGLFYTFQVQFENVW